MSWVTGYSHMENETIHLCCCEDQISGVCVVCAGACYIVCLPEVSLLSPLHGPCYLQKETSPPPATTCQQGCVMSPACISIVSSCLSGIKAGQGLSLCITILPHLGLLSINTQIRVLWVPSHKTRFHSSFSEAGKRKNKATFYFLFST